MEHSSHIMAGSNLTSENECPSDPVSLLLGLPGDHVTDMYQKKLYNVMSFCARKNILQQWITDEAPSGEMAQDNNGIHLWTFSPVFCTPKLMPLREHGDHFLIILM